MRCPQHPDYRRPIAEQARPWPRSFNVVPAWGQFLCSRNSKGGKGERKRGGASELRASPLGPGRLPLPRKEKRKKAVDATGLGGGYVVTGGGRAPPSPAAGARNFLLAGRAHPPMNGNNPWHLAPEVCKAVDNQALLSSLPHSQPSAEGNQGRWGLCPNQEPDSAPGRGLGQLWQRRWQQRPQRAPVYPKSITQHAVAVSFCHH